MSSLSCLALSLLGLSRATQAILQVKQLYQFLEPTQWVENIAVRPNGHLLLTTYDDARMYTIDPRSDDAVPQVVAQLPNATALTGIAEIATDVFAFAAGVLNISDLTFEHGSGQIAVINFGGCRSDETTLLHVRTASRAPSAQLLNGLVALPEHPHILLSSDSHSGTIYRANTVTGHVDVAFQDDRLTPGPGPSPVPLGVNGLKIRNGYLYLTNSARMFFARVKINDVGGQIGALEMITQLPPSSNPAKVPDDFAMSRNGTAYLAVHPDTVAMVTTDGRYSSLVNDGDGTGDVKLDTPTSVALSRDEAMLYVTTGGNAEANGTGGQVVEVSL